MFDPGQALESLGECGHGDRGFDIVAIECVVHDQVVSDQFDVDHIMSPVFPEDVGERATEIGGHDKRRSRRYEEFPHIGAVDDVDEKIQSTALLGIQDAPPEL